MKPELVQTAGPESLQRQVLLRGVVALGITVLAWQVLTRSQQTGLAQARAQVASRQEQLAAFEAAPRPVTDLAAATESLRRTSLSLRNRLAQTADSAKLYEAIGNLAIRQQLRIERIDPLRSTGESAVSAAKAGFEKSGYALDVVGSYDGVARFLDQIQTSLGASRVESLRIEPVAITGNQGALVRATLETLHLRLPPGGLKSDHAVSQDGSSSQARTDFGSGGVK